MPSAADLGPPTIERWAREYIVTRDLAFKLAPPPPSAIWEDHPVSLRIERPGRPAELVVTERAAKSPGPEALRKAERRAQLVHTFLHHELQAAELMAWALLAFADAPRAFRQGLLRIAGDEIRHMAHYRGYLRAIGHDFGEFPVRDWFWERVPRSPSAMHFVAVMGVGFEGGNLDHTARFAERFRAVGDEDGARLQELICEEEIPHVGFALHWLGRWAGAADFTTWASHLPPPLSPLIMRGSPINAPARRRAGMSEAFLEELRRWSETSPGL